MITIISLQVLNDELKENGLALLEISEQLDMKSSMLASIDLSFDEEIIELGKTLPNDSARKIHKVKLQKESEVYQAVNDELIRLKRIKQDLLNNRESLKHDLDIGKLAIRQDCANLEQQNLYEWMTSYQQLNDDRNSLLN